MTTLQWLPSFQGQPVLPTGGMVMSDDPNTIMIFSDRVPKPLDNYRRSCKTMWSSQDMSYQDFQGRVL